MTGGFDTRAVVALERCESYEPEEVLRALDALVQHLGGWGAFVRSGERLLLKPNLLRGAPPEEAVTTHPELLRALARRLKDEGAHPFIGDSPPWSSLGWVSRRSGIAAVARQEGLPLVAFTRGVKVANQRDWPHPHLTVDRAALEADGIINCPKLKSHRQLYMTGAVKNTFGCVTGKRKLWWHIKAGHDNDYFARMLIETCSLLGPRLHLMDAVLAMDGMGASRGRPRHLGFLAASTDAVALDRVCLEIVGGEPDELRTLAAAEELGVGEPRLERIRIAGEPMEAFRVDDFVFPPVEPVGVSLSRALKSTLRYQWNVRLREKLPPSSG